VSGANWAYSAGVIAVALGAVLVFFRFPDKDEEKRLLAEYLVQDSEPSSPATEAALATG
jgi:MFS transporter, DHA2 family, multidrug resistance protein